MKELLVISGKGGTGKTSIVGAFAVLADCKVLADCDVDAADLHLLLSPTVRVTHEFRASKQAVLDSAKCVGAGQCGVGQCGAGRLGLSAVCAEACRFEAIGFANATLTGGNVGRGMSVASTGSAASAGLPHIVPHID